MAQKESSSSPPSSETKSNTKLVGKPRSKPNKQNVYEIDSRVKFDSDVICLKQSQFFANAQQPMGLLHFV